MTDGLLRPVQAVIFDLDGTILDTESLCYAVGKQVVARYGKQLTKDVAKAGIGKRPLDCWQACIDRLGITASAQQLVDETEPILKARWHAVKPLPGAVRLINHLHSHGIPLAIATSTSRSSFICKMSTHADLCSKFSVVVCGDEVVNGKPHPDLYLAAIEKLNIDASACLAIEDAPSGIEAASACPGLQVVAVPSLPDRTMYTSLPCTMLASLLDFQPTDFQLPPFTDFVKGTTSVPLNPVWRIKGPVIKGFGRGSKQLGIPTANLDDEAMAEVLGDAVSGIYYGWASIGSSPKVHKMVMSVGWNPFYDNDRRTCEPWILEDFENDFYGEELRLVVCGYVRPEANFESLDALIQQIQDDGRVARLALDDSTLHALQFDPFLAPKSAT